MKIWVMTDWFRLIIFYFLGIILLSQEQDKQNKSYLLQIIWQTL